MDQKNSKLLEQLIFYVEDLAHPSFYLCKNCNLKFIDKIILIKNNLSYAKIRNVEKLLCVCVETLIFLSAELCRSCITVYKNWIDEYSLGKELFNNKFKFDFDSPHVSQISINDFEDEKGKDISESVCTNKIASDHISCLNILYMPQEKSSTHYSHTTQIGGKKIETIMIEDD